MEREGLTFGSPQLIQEEAAIIKESTVALHHFMLLAVLGKGSYAKVVLVKKIESGEIFAMKILKKEMITKKNQLRHVQNERNILANIQHPFIVKLWNAFQNERKIFFVLDYCPGGELFNLLQKRRVFTEPQARFYFIQLVLAIECLHANDIVYRDLKPENVLIGHDGYIKVADFGLSKMGVKDNRGTNSLCGTPEYLAPEVLFRMGHGKAVDWWTLGALLYEMLTGLPPFYAQRREEVFEKIKFGAVKYPKHISSDAQNLLEGLLSKSPEKRLGGGLEGAMAIKKHPWLADINWEAHLRKEVQPPFVPKLQSQLDLSNFSPEFTQLSVDSVKETPFMTSNEPLMYAKFDGFSFDAQELNAASRPSEKETQMELE